MKIFHLEYLTAMCAWIDNLYISGNYGIDKMNYKSNQYFLAVGRNSTSVISIQYKSSLHMLQKKKKSIHYPKVYTLRIPHCAFYTIQWWKSSCLQSRFFFSDRAIISHCPNLFKQLCWGLMSKLFKFCSLPVSIQTCEFCECYSFRWTYCKNVYYC